ncbi:MAG: alpha/beta fold hydrolase [Cyanobacteria bacterium P01_G01_bin.54]
MKRTSTHLYKLSVGLLLAPIVLIAILILLHWLGWINAWQFPLIPVSAFCIFGSFASLALAGAWPWRSRAGARTRGDRWRQRPRSVLSLALVVVLLVVNLPPYLVAHYVTQVRSPGQLILGRPRPENDTNPSDRGLVYVTHRLRSERNIELESWEIKTTTQPRGTVLLFPGNLSTKSKLLAQAEQFVNLGFDVVLTDFRSVGGSTGKITTAGISEAKDVVAVFNHLKAQKFSQDHPTSPVILYGISMGTAAILRAIFQYQIQPDAIILELPFARLLDSVKSRLRYRKVPTFPIAELLLFWAFVQRGVNGFGHNPVTFARAVNCPTLVLQGAQDQWITVEEVTAIVDNFAGPKQLVIFPDAGHHQLLSVNRERWRSTVASFLANL